MFGLRRRREAAAAEAAREAERRALFAELARRPAHVCPFLGLAYERTGWVEGASIEHRCFAFGEPAPLSSEQQTRVCQERGYGQCPRYLRGVLVTPSEELAAMRNPQPRAGAGPASVPATDDRQPEPAQPLVEGTPARPLPVLGVLLLALLLVAGGALAYMFLAGGLPGASAAESPTPSPTAAAAESRAATPSPRPTRAPSPSPTSAPTPAQTATFAYYEVVVEPGRYVVFEVDDAGAVTDQASATFQEASSARVEPIEGAEGGVYWRTLEGGLEGFAYREPDSGEFRIRAVFTGAGGDRQARFLDDSELGTYPEATPAP